MFKNPVINKTVAHISMMQFGLSVKDENNLRVASLL